MVGAATDLAEAERAQGTEVAIGLTDPAAHLRDLQLAHSLVSSVSAATTSGLLGLLRGRLLRCVRGSRDGEDLGDRQATHGSDVLGTDEPLEAVDGCPAHVDRIRRAEALREHVADAGELEHRARATAGDDAGSFAGRTEHDARGVESTHDLVRDRLTVLRHREEVLACVLDGLRDRERNLARLSVPEADTVDLVADDDERREREAPSTLDDLRHTVDLDDPLLELAGLTHFGHAQNWSPPSRAPSARAFTRPWYR